MLSIVNANVPDLYIRQSRARVPASAPCPPCCNYMVSPLLLSPVICYVEPINCPLARVLADEQRTLVVTAAAADRLSLIRVAAHAQREILVS